MDKNCPKFSKISTKCDSIFAQISKFLKKFFIPFNISTCAPITPKKSPIFRINRASISNYRGTVFSLYEEVVSLKMNNETLKNLEFIQTTGSSRGRAKRPRSRRQVKKARRRSLSYVENVFGRQRRHRALQPSAVELVVWIHSTSVENIRQISLFMQNKPKVK